MLNPCFVSLIRNTMVRPVKSYKVRIQNEAIDELDGIYRYIFSDSPGRARGFLKKLKKKDSKPREIPATWQPRQASRIERLRSRDPLYRISGIHDLLYLGGQCRDRAARCRSGSRLAEFFRFLNRLNRTSVPSDSEGYR